ncbi:MAG TPA: ricin-type beta-trefoil lectin domain protein [Steroidobacteraceae bacterium]|jgi:alpha-galactosidase
MKFISILALMGLSVCFGQPASAAPRLAMTPPMGWNDWAHYQCGFTAQTILANARALVRTGLAARGYDTVTIDDCWMLKSRDRHGDLQVDPRRFPDGMRPVAAAIHALGLKFGIYEDAGYATCGGFAGSGAGKDGGQPHFLADARLFASWGVDYLKLDGCNIQPATGTAGNAAYRAAYQAESIALRKVGRPIVFSESAPAYFQGTPDWYDVLRWVRRYGQLWREGTDVHVYDGKQPERSRFGSVMWNYDYNLQLGRFQTPGNWNDADFIIGGDRGMTLAETRSQLALWSMMSAPLILSSNLDQLSPEAIAILGNRAVLTVDQDPLGRMATLLRRSAAMDLLLKPLQGGEYAVGVLNRSPAALAIELAPRDLGFSGARCRFDVHDLWTGAQHPSAAVLAARIPAHDTDIWKIRPAGACGAPARMGAITRIVPNVPQSRQDSRDYTRCVAAPGMVRECAGTAAQIWRIRPNGTLRSARECLTQIGDRAALARCGPSASQRWTYTLLGNLINRSSHLCLTGPASGQLALRSCGHNVASQIWTLPNDVTVGSGRR